MNKSQYTRTVTVTTFLESMCKRGLRFLAATPNGVHWCVIRSRHAVKGVGRWGRAVILLPGHLQSAQESVVFISVLPNLYRGKNVDSGFMENIDQNSGLIVSEVVVISRQSQVWARCSVQGSM